MQQQAIQCLPVSTHGQTKDMTGLRFGRLMVTGPGGMRRNAAHWVCRCDCGVEKVVSGTHLRTGATKSCGCFRKERTAETRTTHGFAKAGRACSHIYGVWGKMVRRCTATGSKDFKHYGGRGITVCERWLVFENFLADMGVPTEGMTLERKDVNGNYQPGNCCWATRAEQSNNTRRNVIVRTPSGDMTLAQFCVEHRLSYSLARYHIGRGVRSLAGISFEITTRDHHGT